MTRTLTKRGSRITDQMGCFKSSASLRHGCRKDMSGLGQSHTFAGMRHPHVVAHSSHAGHQNVGTGRQNVGTGRRYDISGGRYDISGERYDISGGRYDISGEQYDISGRRNVISGRRNVLTGGTNAIAGLQRPVRCGAWDESHTARQCSCATSNRSGTTRHLYAGASATCERYRLVSGRHGILGALG